MSTGGLPAGGTLSSVFAALPGQVAAAPEPDDGRGPNQDRR